MVSADNERVSVKTVTSSSHVSFKRSTHQHVDRVIVLRLNVEENEASIEELLDCRVDRLSEHVVESANEYIYRVRGKNREVRSNADLAITSEASIDTKRIIQYESGTFTVEQEGEQLMPVLPVLRQIAAEIGVSLLNSAGGPRNTRQLGAEIIAALNS